MIGPLKIKNTFGPNQNHEAGCHLCGWAWFEPSLGKARNMLLWHLDTTHINPPPPYNPPLEKMPGYGAQMTGHVKI